MRRSLAVATRILRQFRHDPRTVFMMIAAPVLALAVLNIIFGSPTYEPTILAAGVDADLAEALGNEGAIVQEVTFDEGYELLDSEEADGMLYDRAGTLVIYLEGSDPSKSGAVLRAVAAAQRDVAADIELDLEPITLPGGVVIEPSNFIDPAAFEPPQEPDLVYVHGAEDMATFDFYGPVFIGVFVFFFVFITAGISFQRERSGGTLERVMATPLRRWEVVLGYVLGYISFAALQTIIVTWASVYWVGFPNLGEFWLVVLVAVSMAIASLVLGILVSEFAHTELQVIQLMQIVVVPQILLSGMFDLSQTPQWMQTLSRCFPLTYGADAMRDVMLRGRGLADVAMDLGVLWAFIAGFFVLNVLALKKYRRI